MSRISSLFNLRIPLFVLLLLPAFTVAGYFGGEISSSHGHVEETEWFDLSYPFDEDTIFYPGQKYDTFELSEDIKGYNQTAKGNYPYWFADFSFCMSEHGGTHVDAPYHFNKLGWKLGEIPLKRMVDVPATVVDVERYVFSLRHPDEFTLEVKHLLEHETRFGQIQPGSVVLIRYGWSRYWPNKQRYLGWNNSTGTTPTLHHPGLSGPAADWLVRERHIYGIGIDGPGLDTGIARVNPVAHIITLGAQVYNIENMANMDYLLKKTRKNSQFGGGSPSNCNLRIFVLPIKTSGTGGPARVLAYCKPGSSLVDTHVTAGVISSQYGHL